jgi:hypothetical protein
MLGAPNQPIFINGVMGSVVENDEMEPAEHPGEGATREETAIWRYMDLPRFVSILATGRLWFPKTAMLRDDPYEGFGVAERLTVPPGDDAPKWVTHQAPDGSKTNISMAEMIVNWSERSAAIIENARNHLYVNSWCLDTSESMAMWQIYGSAGFGVALRSSVEQYTRAARFDVDSSHYVFGKVTYHSDIEAAADIRWRFRGSVPLPGPGLRKVVLPLGLHKRSCYGYENEWRAVLYQDPRPDITGVHEEFDLNELISAVYVGPHAEGFIVDVVSSVMDKFQLRKPLIRSPLLNSPRKQIAAAE